MKITPLEIRQKTFEKKLRGYDKDEVNAFLMSLSQEWERMMDENKEYKIKLQSSEKEVDKLREVESSLYKTLKTAEDTGANMIEQANKTAELHLRETQMTADSVLNEAKTKARNMVEEAENESRRIMDEMERQIHALHQVYKDIIHQKQALIADIRRLSNENLDRVEKLEIDKEAFDIEGILKDLKKLHIPPAKEKPKAREGTNKEARVETESSPPQESPPEKEMIEAPKSDGSDSSKSFFDEIE